MFRPPLVYSRFKVLEHKGLTVSMKMFMNDKLFFSSTKFINQTGSRTEPPTEGCGGGSVFPAPSLRVSDTPKPTPKMTERGLFSGLASSDG